MSVPEYNPEPDTRSSVKVTRNAKGDAQWEVKVAEGTTQDELDRVRMMAVDAHKKLLAELA